MKNFLRALALGLLVAMLATIPAMAETTAVEALLGTDIDASGAELGLEKTQTQDEDDAFLTIYENEGVMLGGRDGSVIDITLFNDSYEIYGVTLGMTLEEVKAALDANGIEYTEDTIVELDTPTIVFDAPNSETAVVSFEFDEDKVYCAQIETAVDLEEDTEEDTLEETLETASKNSTGYLKLTGDCHVRKSADKTSKSLGVVKSGAKFKYTATAKDNRGVWWCKISKGNKTGWVSTKYAVKISKNEFNNSSSKSTAEKKASGTIKTTGSTNVRQYPDKNSKSLGILPKGHKEEYSAIAKDSRGVTWYKVITYDGPVWISSKCVKKIS